MALSANQSWEEMQAKKLKWIGVEQVPEVPRPHDAGDNI